MLRVARAVRGDRHRAPAARQRGALLSRLAPVRRGPTEWASAGGEVASQIAAGVLQGRSRDSGSPEAALRTAARAANTRIHERSHSHIEQAGMGTTLTAMYVGAEDVSIAARGGQPRVLPAATGS